MSLVPIDNYPYLESSGIPRNATVWVQFNKTLDTSTVSYITVSVCSTLDEYIPIEGLVDVEASSSGMADSIIRFLPDPAFDAYKRYVFTITGGSDGIKAYDGDQLAASLEYFFTIGSGTTDNPDVAATGVPEPSSYIPTSNLSVVKTDPAQYASNVSVTSPYIMIQFSDAIPTGTNLYNYIKLSNTKVL